MSYEDVFSLMQQQAREEQLFKMGMPINVEPVYEFPDTQFDSGATVISESADGGLETVVGDGMDTAEKSRKKAQNRAAQRAFRERKEARLKELASKLQESEADKESLLAEIEQLRKLNMEISAANASLMLKNSTYATGKCVFPLEYEPGSRPSKLHVAAAPRSMTMQETWDYLTDLSQHQDFDVWHVISELKGKQHCDPHGKGPAYWQQEVDQVVQQHLKH